MSWPHRSCPHHRPGGRLVCQSCSSLTSFGDDRGPYPENNAALDRYLQHPAVRNQAYIDTQTLYRQRPTPETVYGEDPTVAYNIVNGARPSQLPENYPYAREIHDGDLFEQGPPAVNRHQLPRTQPLPTGQRSQIRGSAPRQSNGDPSSPLNATQTQLRGADRRPQMQPTEAPYMNGDSRRTPPHHAAVQRPGSSMLDVTHNGRYPQGPNTDSNGLEDEAESSDAR